MNTIAIVSQKGGSGKTTLALHLAVAFVAAERSTSVIDLDPQVSAANWSDRCDSELPVVLSAHARRLPGEMRRMREIGGEMLYLDTAPHSDSAALEAARATDQVLIPYLPAIFDVEAITNTLAFLLTTGKSVAVVLNAVAPRGRTRLSLRRPSPRTRSRPAPSAWAIASHLLVRSSAARQHKSSSPTARPPGRFERFTPLVLARFQDFKPASNGILLT